MSHSGLKGETFAVVAYDISDPKRLRHVAEIMEDFGARVQFSVFEVELSDADFSLMKERLEAAIKPNEDQVRFYIMCRACLTKIEVLGKPKIDGWDDVIIV